METESEQMAHAFGMKAFLATKLRKSNPWDYGTPPNDFTAALCKAFFQGWDDAERANQ